MVGMPVLDQPLEDAAQIAPQRGQATLSWDDVFVSRRMPLRPFVQSAVAHGLTLAFVLAASQVNWGHPEIAPQPEAASSHTILYLPSEYLPSLDTRTGRAQRRQEKPDPMYSRQPIISLPREAENHSQTVVTPADVKLARPVALPNIVDWPGKPHMPVVPAQVTLAAEITRIQRDAPPWQNSVVAPPPDVRRTEARHLQLPQQAVIAPPPTTVDSSVRNLGDLAIAPAAVIAPAPQLTVAEQRSYAGRPTAGAPNVVAPPPSAPTGTRSAGALIALNLQPTVGAPPNPSGNRRGNFAATPEGHSGASGAAANTGVKNGTGESDGAVRESGLPAGLYVGKPILKVASTPGATAPSPRVNSPTAAPAWSSGSDKLSAAEREVFGSRRIYSLTLNMPNLNSAGGSWVVRFAERNAEGSQQANPASPGLSAPLAVRKIDPAYPTELMRQNVGGTVTLYAVIHADGSVGQVRVLEGADDRLDLYASQALARWEFRPAIRSGTPVEVEAVFQIPFKPLKRAGF